DIDIPRVLREMRAEGQTVVCITVDDSDDETLFVLATSTDAKHLSGPSWGACESFYYYNALQKRVAVKDDPVTLHGPTWLVYTGESKIKDKLSEIYAGRAYLATRKRVTAVGL